MLLIIADSHNLKYKITLDTILWNDFRSGDDVSFALIYKTYVQPLFKYGSKFTNDKDLLLDCIQEVFTDIFTHRHSIGETNNIKLYLFISLKRKIICSLKNETSLESFSDNETPFFLIYHPENEVTDFENNIGKMDELKKALNKLSPKQQEAIYLRYVSELDYKEICQILNLNYQSIRNLVHRAIVKLRKILTCSSFPLFLLL